jgi:hypothetical protein
LGSMGLSRLPQLSSLRSLRLLGTKLNDSDLECLGRLPNLRTLDLMDAGITDIGLAHLKGSPKLEELYLRAMQGPPDEPPLRVTEEGIRALQKALPKLKVQY